MSKDTKSENNLTKNEKQSDIDPKKFLIQKSPKEIKNTILKNITRMLMLRGELSGYDHKKSSEDPEKFMKYYKSLKHSEDSKNESVFTIDSDTTSLEKTLDNNDVRKYAIMWYPSHLNSVNIQAIKNFMEEYQKYFKILVVVDATQNPYEEYKKNPNTEIFKEAEFMQFIPQHKIIPPSYPPVRDPKKVKKILKELNLQGSQPENIYTDQDPLARMYNLKPDEIIKLDRAGNNTISYPVWRLAKKGNYFRKNIKTKEAK